MDLRYQAGAPKIGKSWLSLQLAKAIAFRGGVSGNCRREGPVLVCALEDYWGTPAETDTRNGLPAYLIVDFIPIPAQGSQPWSMHERRPG
jgi:hypothetical protein